MVLLALVQTLLTCVFHLKQDFNKSLRISDIVTLGLGAIVIR